MYDALVIDPRDDVATALHELEPGSVETNRGTFTVVEAIPSGHKFALRELRAGAYLTKYGETVGVVKQDIAPGMHVHVHNLGDPMGTTHGAAGRAKSVGLGDEVPVREPRTGSWDPQRLRARTFMGYARDDGQVGIRNSVLVLSTVGCANLVAERIAAKTDAALITHQQGCLQLGDDMAMTQKQLLGAAANPNVGAVLLVSLGCEFMQPSLLDDELGNKPRAIISIQSEGGTRSTIAKGIELVRELQQKIAGFEREEFPLSKLIVGTKCGGSDAFSGLTANPAVGVAADMLVDAGASVLLSETPGLFGSEPFLAARMIEPRGAEQLTAALDRIWEESIRLGEPISGGEMSPGNIAGGLTTLIEKSLGANTKAGTRRFEGFLNVSDRVPHSGLWIMDTPGYDIATISAQAAGGAQLGLFTTGRGSPVGCAIMPIVKVCTNSRTYSHMQEDMDVNAGAIIDGSASLEEVGSQIFELIIRVASGETTASEDLGHGEFALAKVGSLL